LKSFKILINVSVLSLVITRGECAYVYCVYTAQSYAINNVIYQRKK